jgi:hypothetical protein
VLPTWLEPVRESLEKVLPKIELSKNNKDNSIISDQQQ